MKLLAIVLVATLVALQYPLWFGKGGWLRVRDLQQQVDAQKAVTAKLDARNRAFDAEVRDLKSGYDALEERARSELGMIRQDEMFFQFAPRGTTSSNFLPFGSAPPSSGASEASSGASPDASSAASAASASPGASSAASASSAGSPGASGAGLQGAGSGAGAEVAGNGAAKVAGNPAAALPHATPSPTPAAQPGPRTASR